jgi:4-hydroxybenzoyl-CoA reductase subunit beta
MSEMAPLPPFALHRPTTVEACIELMATHADAKIVAGGTDLLPSMKQGLFEPPTLISIHDIAALKSIEVQGTTTSIGSGVTLLDAQNDGLITHPYPALGEACSQVGTPTIQAMGTLGGNLLLDTRCIWYNQSAFWRDSLGGCLKCEGSVCHVAPKGSGCYAAHSADTVPVLMLLKAEAEFVGPNGTRRVPVSELYDSDGLKGPLLKGAELLTRIIVPAPKGRIAFRKLRVRAAIDYPLLLTAIRVDHDESGALSGGAIVLSAIGPQPLEIQGVSEAIRARDIDGAAEIAFKQAMPLSTHNTASTWRKKMVRVEVRRALTTLLENA